VFNFNSKPSNGKQEPNSLNCTTGIEERTNSEGQQMALAKRRKLQKAETARVLNFTAMAIKILFFYFWKKF
jgi:hypothetical protein